MFAPHAPTPAAINRLQSVSPPETILYSQADPATAAQATTLLIDNVGLLNTLYRYGRIAYIGGGFGKGIHNTLEPAAFGLPVIFGPKYEKFEEARQLVTRGGAFVVHNATELGAILWQLQQDHIFYENASRAVLSYLEESRGATEKILKFFEGSDL